jgi:Na+/H+ antiporter NhaD/arsenite permease-like protein
VGAVLANLFGTTGASMLLVRPLLRINRERRRVTHTIVFFIFLVSNVGGCLTPLGDPPLLLGFLAGVPFTWTLRLWRPWALVTGALLAVYLAIDTVERRREPAEALRADRGRREPFAVSGLWNAGLLIAVVLAVALLAAPFRELVMIAAVAVSLATTPHLVRARNAFSAGPIVEVAVIFAGIFVAMTPALQILEAKAAALGVREPWQFFAVTGALSAFLDNAPAYLAFVSVAKGLSASLPPGAPAVELDGSRVAEAHLVAISLGAVFMGALTYIGNGPNFMVKAIAERAGVRMPTFARYLGWSVAVLGPLFVCVALLFLR